MLYELRLCDRSRTSEYYLVIVYRVYSECLEYFNVDMKWNVVYKGARLQLTIWTFYLLEDGFNYRPRNSIP
jgi:hypothetical protein